MSKATNVVASVVQPTVWTQSSTV